MQVTVVAGQTVEAPFTFVSPPPPEKGTLIIEAFLTDGTVAVANVTINELGISAKTPFVAAAVNIGRYTGTVSYKGETKDFIVDVKSGEISKVTVTFTAPIAVVLEWWETWPILREIGWFFEAAAAFFRNLFDRIAAFFRSLFGG